MLKQLQWLNEKKLTLTKQIQKLTNDSTKQIEKVSEQMNVLNRKYEECINSAQRSRKQAQNLEESLSYQIRQLESSLKARTKEKQTLDLTVIQNQETINQQSRTIDELTKELKAFKNKNESLESSVTSTAAAHHAEIISLEQKQKNTVEELISKYERLIESKISEIVFQHKSEIESMQEHNKHILAELEKESRQNKLKSVKEIKEQKSDHQRIIDENQRLLSQVNQMKRKLLNLQTELDSKEQEQRLLIKEKQLVLQNKIRQIDCLQEELKSQKSKYHENIENIQLVQWEKKQFELRTEKQVKKIQIEGLRKLEEYIQTATEQIHGLNSKLHAEKEKNQELQSQVTQLKHKQQSLQKIVSYHKRKQVEESSEAELSELRKLHMEHTKEIVKKNAEIEVLKEQNKRIKSKVNRVSAAFQEHLKSKQIMEQENKMLLSEIVFLREKNKRAKTSKENSINNSRFLDMKSQQSREYQDVQTYKDLIAQMEKQMNQALGKLNEKNTIIEKQKLIIDKLQNALKL